MSLVNDLLINAERRRNGSPPARTVRLDDLVPARKSGASRSGTFGLGAAVLCFSAAALAAGFASWKALPLLRPEAAPVSSSAPPGEPPPVAARLAEEPGARDPNAAPLATAVDRPARLESISLERTPTSTRLRIATDRRTPHRIERDVDSARLDLILGTTALTDPTTPLDLLDTPIRSFDLRDESPDLRIALELDANVQTQTRWLELQEGAVLVVELQSPRDPAAGPIVDSLSSMEPAPLEAIEIEPQQDDLVVLRGPAYPHVDRTVPAALGDPEALRIERSQRDLDRESRATRRAAIARILESARRAHSEGRLDEADERFAEFASLAPNEPAALIEWSKVLVELDRAEDALVLVEGARARSPRDPGLLITHARLLEKKGELPLALALIEQSGLSLMDAPDVHAIAAAYHQRSGDHAGAIERYEQILRRFPEESRGWMGLGISLEAVGRSTEARDVYRIALQVGELPGGTRRWISSRLSALDEED